MVIASFKKASAARKDYAIDWSAWLDGDIITGSVWSVSGSLNKVSDQFSNNITTVWVDGGNGRSVASNLIQTAGGRTEVGNIEINVED